MEISLLEVLLKTISTFLHLSKDDNISSDPVQKYYQKAEEILKLLKPVFDAIVDSEVASDEVLNKDFLELGRSVDELREIFESWQPLSSKVYSVSFQLYFCVIIDGMFVQLMDFQGGIKACLGLASS